MLWYIGMFGMFSTRLDHWGRGKMLPFGGGDAERGNWAQLDTKLVTLATDMACSCWRWLMSVWCLVWSCCSASWCCSVCSCFSLCRAVLLNPPQTNKQTHKRTHRQTKNNTRQGDRGQSCWKKNPQVTTCALVRGPVSDADL